LRAKWILSKWQLMGLAIYSCAFPLGVYLQNQHQIPGVFLIVLINLPFLLILVPLMMLAEPFHIGQLLSYFLAWAIIFAQSYLAFIHLRSRSERSGTNTSKALISSLGRLAGISAITLIIGGLILALLFKLP